MTGRPVSIGGLGTCLPERTVTNDDLSAFLDTSDEWITQRTGIRSRRVADEGLCASDLGIVAARAALDDAGVSPAGVDLVITATISPDRVMPATASRVAYEVGAVNAGAFDLSAGCTGFVYALAAGTGMVSSGLSDRVLVVGAEAISRFLDWEDRSTAILFGDGAGAVLLRARHRTRAHPRVRPGERRLRRVASSRYPREDPACPPATRRSTSVCTTSHERPGGLPVRHAGDLRVGHPGPPAVRALHGRDRPVRPAPGQPAHHRVGGGQARHPAGEDLHEPAAHWATRRAPPSRCACARPRTRDGCRRGAWSSSWVSAPA